MNKPHTAIDDNTTKRLFWYGHVNKMKNERWPQIIKKKNGSRHVCAEEDQQHHGRNKSKRIEIGNLYEADA